MKFFTKFFFLSLLMIGGFGCNCGKPPAGQPDAGTIPTVQCAADTDCADGCDGYDGYICASNGQCACIKTVKPGCSVDTDCATSCSGHDMHACFGGTCFCSDEAVSLGVLEVSLSASSPPSSTIPQLAKDVLLTCFDFTARNADVPLSGLVVTRAGVGELTDWEQLRLYEGAYQLTSGNSISSTTNTAGFLLDVLVEQDTTRTLCLLGDVTPDAGAGNQHLFSIASATAVRATTEMVTGSFPIQGNTHTIAGVTLPIVTITDNGPAGRVIPHNSLNNHMLNWEIVSERDVRVRDMDLTIHLSGSNGAGPNVAALGSGTVTGSATTGNACYSTAGAVNGIALGDAVSMPTVAGTIYAIVTGVFPGDCDTGSGTRVTTNSTAVTPLTAGTIQEFNPYDFIRNVKVVDRETGSTLMGPLNFASDGALNAGPPSFYTKRLTEDYELIAGVPRQLGVRADLIVGMPAGYEFWVTINYLGPGYIKDDNRNENILESEIVNGTLTGRHFVTGLISLSVSLASTPVSNVYVKGAEQVPSLGIQICAGPVSDITIKKLTVRAYADDVGGGGWSATGDRAANTVVSSLILMDGADVVAGSGSLTLVDTGTAGFVADTADYYRVLFDNLNMVIGKGGCKTLTVNANLLNTMNSVTYYALDLDPAFDVLAEDEGANTVIALGNPLNAESNIKDPEITVLTQGTLTAFAENNPDSSILIAGSTGQLVSRYRFHALREMFIVNKLTVMNDVSGDVGNAVPTGAVSQVMLSYQDCNAVTQTKTGVLSGGSVILSGLEVCVPKNGDAFVEIWADVTPMAAFGEALSGQTFRLGIQNSGNSVVTFEAIGQLSSTTDNFNDGDEIANQATVNTFVVRKTKPTFTKATGLSTTLINGENRLYGVTVTCDSAGSCGFGRFPIWIDWVDAGATLRNFKFYRGSTLINSSVNIFSTTADVSDGSGNDFSGNILMISFDLEETVVAGSSQTYYLDAEVLGISAADSFIQTYILSFESNKFLALSNPCYNPATGRVYDTDGSGIFDIEDGFSRAAIPMVTTVVWSDKSSDTHAYPTVTSGVVTVGTGSCDWTNGYGLGLDQLPAHILTF